MKVREVMTRGIEGIQSSDSILRAAGKMKELDIGSLAVFDGNRLTGVLTDRDIVVRVLASSLNPAHVSVGEVMSRDPKLCKEDADLDEAAHIMETNKIRRLIVEDADGRITGIITIDDIAMRGEERLVPEVIREVKQHIGPIR